MWNSTAIEPVAGVAELVTLIVYRIATGAWPPGRRLPSLREGERRWCLERRGVMRAYAEVADRGLIERVPRSGYFVASGPPVREASGHRYELEAVYGRFDADIRATSELSPLAVFRYLAHLAEIRAERFPEVAFVGCTAAQASGHAAEVRARLALPCLAITVEEIGGREDRVPAHVRCLLVSAFHVGEIRPSSTSLRTRHAVPVELSPTAAAVARSADEVVVVEFDRQEADNIAADLARMAPSTTVRATTVSRPAEEELRGLVDGGRTVLLAPRVWGSVDPRWRAHPQVDEAHYRIRPDAWPAISRAIGLPLGDLAAGAR